MGTWSNWMVFDGPTPDNKIDVHPSVTSLGHNRLSLFVVSGAATYFRPWEAGKGWGRWVNLGGLATTGPGSVAWPPNHLEVYVSGNDYKLYRDVSNNSGATWSGFSPVPIGDNSLASTPTAAARAANSVDVFYVDSAEHVRRVTWLGSHWSPVEDVGCCFNSLVSLAYQFGQPWIYTWARKEGGVTWANNWSAATNRWAGWRPQTPAQSVPLVAVVPPSGTFYYF